METVSSLAWVLPAFACIGGASPWAGSVDDVACIGLERLLGSCSERVFVESGFLLINFLMVLLASCDVSDHLDPDVWTDGSFVLDELSGVGVGGCGVYSLKSGAGWFGRRCGSSGVVASWC